MLTEANMQHGRDYNGEDVSGWLMSEKLNGCRAYWDGETMWSRGGRVINIPDAMRMMLPKGIHLDGEMFCPLDFNNAKRAVQYSRFVASVEFHVFDLPTCPGSFSERYSALMRLLKFHTNHVKMVPVYHCPSIDRAVCWMKEIQVKGGEGVMLRDPADIYQPGRSRGLLKLKEEPCNDQG